MQARGTTCAGKLSKWHVRDVRKSVAKYKRKNRLMIIKEPSGRYSRAKEDREFAPAEVKRLRDAAMSGMRDEEWGTELGRLFLEGTISGKMYAAGKWWRKKAADYLSAIDAPAPGLKPQKFEFGSLGTPPDPDSFAGKEQAKADNDAVVEFLGAHAALLGAGALAERAVRKLCEQDLAMCGAYELECVKRGLSWIANYRDLTNGQKSRHAR